MVSEHASLWRGVITSLIISYRFFSSSLSGVVILLKDRLIEWSWQSNLISPVSSLETFTLLSVLDSLKDKGLHLQTIPVLGLMLISFRSCIFPWHTGQSMTMFLLVSLCSSVSVMYFGCSSLDELNS